MPPDPDSGLRLPATEVAAPRSLWRFVLVRLLVVAAIALLMDLFLSRTSRDFIEAAIFLGLIALLAMLQIPLLERRWRRADRQRLARLAPGTVYAGAARAETTGPARASAGELVLDRAGVSFTPKDTAQSPALNAGWAEITRLSLRPAPAAPLAGALEIGFARGPSRTFLVQRFAPLAEVLSNLAERL